MTSATPLRAVGEIFCFAQKTRKNIYTSILIENAKNSVGPGFGPGADNPISLHTLETSVYRVTGMNQIQDIIDCGYVRPKGYGSRADRVGDKLYWSQGGSKLYYHDKRPVIEAFTDKVKDGQIGAISINDL